MSNSVEQQGGFFAYLWNNLVASVASRTVGSNMNDGNCGKCGCEWLVCKTLYRNR